MKRTRTTRHVARVTRSCVRCISPPVAKSIFCEMQAFPLRSQKRLCCEMHRCVNFVPWAWLASRGFAGTLRPCLPAVLALACAIAVFMSCHYAPCRGRARTLRGSHSPPAGRLCHGTPYTMAFPPPLRSRKRAPPVGGFLII